MQNIRRLVVPLLLTMVLLVAGCAGQAKKDATTAYEGSQPQLAPADVYEEKSVHMTEASQTADGERMVISTVKLVILVDDTNVTLTELRSLVQAQQGYISNSQQWLSNEQPYAHVTLRVPAESLNATLDAIRGLALRVQSESIAGEDVTEEYINLDARLSHLEETQKELLALLADVRKSGGKAEDILAVYDKVLEVGQEIETLKGRQKYLATMTAMATFNIEIQPKAAPVSASGDSEWSPLVTLSKAWRAFVSALQIAVTVLIYLVLFLGTPALIVWLIVWLVRRRKTAAK